MYTEATKKATQKYRLANPERIRAIAKKSYQKHREERIAKVAAYQKVHPPKRAPGMSKWQKQNSERITLVRVKRLYGLSPEQYYAILPRLKSGPCEICGTTKAGGKGKFHIDHEDRPDGTKIVRGVLCNQHNPGIGLFNHDPILLRRAARYLETHKGTQPLSRRRYLTMASQIAGTSAQNEAITLSTGTSGVDPIRLARTDVARMVKEAKQSCKTVRECWLKQAEESDSMFAGHQWEAKDVAFLNERQRPIFSFNYILRTILGILGLEIGNRQQPLVQARNSTVPGQNELAELATELTKYIWDTCEGDEHMTLAFFDNLRRGMGWLEVYMDYEEDPEGIVKFKRINGIQMYFDAAADEPNLSNSFWRMRSLKMPWRQIEMLWGKDTATELKASLILDGDQSMETVHNISPVGYLPGSEVVQHDAPMYGDVTIDQFQYYTWDEAYQGLDPDADPNDPNAKLVTVDREGKKDLEQLSAAKGKPNPVLSRFNKKTFKQSWVAGKFEIESITLPVPDFTFQCMTGIRDEKEHIYFGIVKVMTDPALSQ